MNNILVITQETLQESSASEDYQLGLIPFSTAEAALAAGEATCLTANKLTAPFSGIETRNSVLEANDGSFRTIIFPIKTA
ncbi:MAG: hypothetical protein HY986_02500 [Candidatus Melainabacteria bacterium]|nr:hypothetical protein [Candidatus Melainabacteria bacterium]